MRRILIIIGALLGILVVLVLALPALIDVNQYRGAIQAQLEKRMQRKITLGNMTLKVIPLSIRIEDLSIGESPAFPSTPTRARRRRTSTTTTSASTSPRWSGGRPDRCGISCSPACSNGSRSLSTS